MNFVLMKEIDLETMLTLLKNHYVITDQEEHILRGKGPIGRYVSENYDHSLTRTSFPLSEQVGRPGYRETPLREVKGVPKNVK